MFRLSRPVLGVVILALASVVRAQSGASEEPRFSVKVNLVRLLVSVFDSTGRPVSDLNANDFEILDSGVRQTISAFQRNTSLPLSVAILVDTSGSTLIDLHYEVDSVGRFIPTLLNAGNPEDAFALFSFNWRTNLEADFSRNQKRAERALHALKGDGGTSLYDALYLASGRLQDREGRHVMVVVTDGGDTTSYKHFNDALDAAQHADAVVYPIVVVPIANDVGRNLGGEHALATIAWATGGRIFYPEGFDRLDEAFTEILRELRTQYSIAYYPQNTPEGHDRYHRVEVRVARPNVRVSSRSGYFAP